MTAHSVDQQITFLYTQNLKATVRFYEQVLGLQLALDQNGACRIYRITDSAFLGFCAKDEVSPHHTDVIFTLVSADVDAWYQHLVQHAVEITRPPTLSEQYQVYHLFFRDPNGYTIEIQEFKDPRWQP